MTIEEKAKSELTKEFYGPDAAIGDGALIELFVQFLSAFLGGCPLGARRAHAMANGGPVRRALARVNLLYAAYQFTNGDYEMANKLTNAAMEVGSRSTVKEFEELAALNYK